MTDKLTDAETEVAYKELMVKFPRVERLPVDPPVAGQNYGLFSFKLLPKPLNGVYGFLKFRGAFGNEVAFEAHAKNLIRTVDSKHHIWPYEQGRWMPITVNDDFVKDTLEVSQQEELGNIFNQRESEEQKQQAQQVREIKSREKKLMDEVKRREPDKSSLDYYAQQVMKVQQLVSWLDMIRKRKHDMIKALAAGREEIARVEADHPEYKSQIDDKIRQIKEEVGLDVDAPLDRPSFSKT